ncbi:MAG TPA: CCA tRNA nucleotidyltransferase [Gemmatimonadaceae bacterium]|nr:CCA tRNA nucleotidyltransferase [Gemmatimonadaceae bacterium]
MSASRQPALLRPPATVLQITRDLEAAGFEAWCVGGAVRDALLGHPHLDWDLATNATPDQVRSIFGRKRTIPVGIEFGTVKVLDEYKAAHEVTTFRRDVKTDGRHAEVEFGASLDEDLSRRDFTVNAMAYSPSRRALHDPFGGQADLEARVIRAVGDPVLRMREDRLRALRAIRFAGRLDFSIDAPTWDAVRDSAPNLTRLSAERVQQEIVKTMDQVAAPSRAFGLWREAGALQVLLPEVAGISDEALHALDCAAQPGTGRKPGRRLGRVALLFSDTTSAKALEAATRLRFSKQESQWIAGLVDRWHTVGASMSEALPRGEPGDETLRRWIAAVGRLHLAAFFRFASARWSARRDERRLTEPAPTARAVHSLYRRALRAALREPVDLRDLAVDGDDLRQLGIAPGPELGRILAALLDLVLGDPGLNTRERLLDEARRLHSGGK